MKSFPIPLGVAITLVMGVTSGGVITAQDGVEPEYAAVSGRCGVRGSTITGPEVIDETGWVPYAYAEGYDAVLDCTMTDPRLSGRLVSTQNYAQLAAGLEGGYIRAGKSLLQNDGGSWLIEYTGYTQPGRSAYTDNTYWNLYTGQGGYAGLSAVAAMLPSGRGSWELEGVLFPGPMPEAPDSPEPLIE